MSDAEQTDRSVNRAAPGNRGRYRLFVSAATRWADNDAFGHLNNIVHLSLIDTALCRRFMAAGIGQDAGSARLLLVVESGCRFHGELRFPDAIEIGLRLGAMGRSSMRSEAGLFRAGSDVAAAEGFMVHVCVDARSRRPAELPAPWRAALRSQEEAGGWIPG